MQSSTPTRTATTRRYNNNHNNNNNNNNTKAHIMTMTRATIACNKTMTVRGASGSIFVSIALLLLVAFSGNMKVVSMAAAATVVGITAEETVNNTNTRTHLRHSAAGDSVTVADEAVTTAAMTLRTNTAATVAVVQSSPRAQLAQAKYLRFVANVLLDDEGGSGSGGNGANGGRGTDSSGSLGGLGGFGGGLGGSGNNLVPIKSAAAAAVAASISAKAFNDSLASEVLSTSSSESTAEWTTHMAFVIVKCFVIILIILAAILGNVLVIVSVCRHRKLR